MTSFSDYAAIEAVNWNTLKHMEKSPFHYRHACDHGSPDSAGRLKGRGTHTAVLEPHRFMIDYACYKGKTRRGKDWEAFKAIHASEDILKINEYEHCIAVARSVTSNSLAASILTKGDREVSLEWIDADTGLRCKARPDLLTPDGIYDLKGVRSTDLRVVAAEVARMRYHAQLAWYQEAVKRALGKTLPAYLICAEHLAPHDVVVNDCGGEEAIYMGWELCRSLLDRVAECRASGKWPGRYTEIQSLTLPAWVWPEDDQEMSVSVSNDEEENDNAGL